MTTEHLMAFMLTLLKQIKKNWGILFLSLVLFAIFAINFPYGKWLIGWDALNPELNIWLNLKYALQAGWQPHYGTGALIGHGYAATLPHILIVGLMNLFLPIEAVRPVFIMLCWYVGSTGMYYLLSYLIKKIDPSIKDKEKKISTCLAITGALFYGFNLGTTQIFYHPLEAFTVQFALFPWFFFILEKYFDTRKLTFLGLLFFVSFFGSIQGFIPSNFLAFIIGVGLYLFVKIFDKKWFLRVKQSMFAIAVIFLSNTYWFGIFVYYTLTKNHVFLNAYQNLILTPQFLAKSEQYGTVEKIITFRSLFLEGRLFDQNVFTPWLDFLSRYPVNIFYYVVFGLALLSILLIVTKKSYRFLLAYFLPFLFFFSSIATNTPIFRNINQFLYKLSPLYEQAFRTAFTKVGIGYTALITILFTVSLYWAIKRIEKKHARSFISVIYFAITIAVILPHFQGNSFYKHLKIEFPQAYQEVISFFNTQPSQSYIADLPLGCNEGWYSYDWEYTGSGFYWYGVKQPFLARSFDVWNEYNESYYWQADRALRQNNFVRLNNTFNKYQVSWVLIDPNLTHCRTSKGYAYIDELKAFFDQSANYELVFETTKNVNEPISIYKRKLPEPANAAIETEQFSPVTDLDSLYKSNIAYVESQPQTQKITSLFSQKESIHKVLSVSENKDKLTINVSNDQSNTLDFFHYDLGDELLPIPCVEGDNTSTYEAEFNQDNSIKQIILETNQTDDCISFYLNAQDFNQGGVISFSAYNQSGTSLTLIVSDELSSNYLSVRVKNGINTYYIPPVNPAANEIEVRFVSQAFDNKKTINQVSDVVIGVADIQPIETVLTPSGSEPIEIATTYLNQTKIKHQVTGPAIIVLNNSFDSDWLAIVRNIKNPIFSPKSYQFLSHYRYNGWANVWEVPSGEYKVYIFYWPQILVIAGYGITIISGTIIVLLLFTKQNKSYKRKYFFFHKIDNLMHGKK